MPAPAPFRMHASHAVGTARNTRYAFRASESALRRVSARRPGAKIVPVRSMPFEPASMIGTPRIMDDKRIARICGLSLGGIFICSLLLNALAF